MRRIFARVPVLSRRCLHARSADFEPGSAGLRLGGPVIGIKINGFTRIKEHDMGIEADRDYRMGICIMRIFSIIFMVNYCR